ncbi:MAG: hypothetical protein LUG85_05005 [Clostridiales bacterium]|nr:hypothetical protein [Clostridiales bacterium]
MSGENENGGRKNGKIKSKKRNTARNITVSVLCILAAAAVISRIYIASKNSSITSEIALADSVTKTIEADVFVVRDEKVISSSGSNIVSAVADGTRVSAGDTIAYSFADSASAVNVTRMQEIEELLEYYNSLSGQSYSVTSDTSSYDSRITDDLCNFSSLISSGDLSSLSDYTSELRDAITSKQTATGVELDLSSVITSLQSEYSALASSSSSYTAITADSPGYYIQGSDGYENTLAYSDADSWTVAQAEEALNASPSAVSSSAVGRLVRSYYWYLVAVIDTGDISNLREGSSMVLSFPDSSVGDIKTTVYRITSDGETGKSLVVFSCNLMNENLAGMRCEEAQIIVESYEGYRIDNGAIRVNEDGETGVYVISGSVIRFKKIEIVYSAEDYSIVTNPYKDDATKSGQYLNLYDEYITSGKDLYDGKLVD